MFTRIIAPYIFLTSFVASVRAARTAYFLPDYFNANELTEVRIDQRIEENSELRNRFQGFRVYLTVEPPGWGGSHICWLAFLEDIDTQYINITIPADVVPDRTRVRLSTSLIHKGTGRNNGWDFSYNTVPVRGGNGTWSQRELDGWGVVTDQDETSCWAYGCVRECSSRYYTDKFDNKTAAREADACGQQCLKDLNPAGDGAGSVIPVMSVLVFSATAVLALYL